MLANRTIWNGAIRYQSSRVERHGCSSISIKLKVDSARRHRHCCTSSGLLSARQLVSDHEFDETSLLQPQLHREPAISPGVNDMVEGKIRVTWLAITADLPLIA